MAHPCSQGVSYGFSWGDRRLAGPVLAESCAGRRGMMSGTGRDRQVGISSGFATVDGCAMKIGTGERGDTNGSVLVVRVLDSYFMSTQTQPQRAVRACSGG